MVITERDKNISDHLGKEYEKVHTYQCVRSQESKIFFFGTFSGMIDLLFLNVVHIIPKIVKFKSYKTLYHLLTFYSFHRDIFDLQCHNKEDFLFTTLCFMSTSIYRDKQLIFQSWDLDRFF